MFDEAPPGEAGPNPYAHQESQPAAARDGPVVPTQATMSQSPSPLPRPKVPYQGPPGPAEGVQAEHERHQPARESLPRAESGRPETEDVVNQLGRELAQACPAERRVTKRPSAKAGMPPELLSPVVVAQHAYRREVGVTIQSGFEPPQRSTFVLGRPVHAGRPRLVSPLPRKDRTTLEVLARGKHV